MISYTTVLVPCVKRFNFGAQVHSIALHNVDAVDDAAGDMIDTVATFLTIFAVPAV